MNGGRIIYVVGCGRSGTTILGFCLGNADRALDLGEVLDFARFRGEPNGFGPETPTHAFWQRVVARTVESAEWPGFDAFLRWQSACDGHLALVRWMVTGQLGGAALLRRYRAALKCLYDAILEESGGAICIDSSKYPSRLIHLAEIYGPEQLSVIHLIRDPAGLVQASAGSDQGPPRAMFPTLLYYSAINTAVAMIIARYRRLKAARLEYERLSTEPASVLAEVGHTLDADLSRAIRRIDAGEPLLRGYVFNGNRMRMRADVVFKARRAGEQAPTSDGLLVRAARKMFMA